MQISEMSYLWDPLLDEFQLSRSAASDTTIQKLKSSIYYQQSSESGETSSGIRARHFWKHHKELWSQNREKSAELQ